MEIQREKRIGILGGSFNPTHNAHIRMARTALWELHLDEVRFLISRDPPHKHLSGDVTDTQRLEMLKLAISVEEGFCVDERELHREGKSYTVISLEQIALEQPDARLYLIVGSDMLKSFSTWYKPERLVELAELVCVTRLGHDGGEAEAMEALKANMGLRASLLDMSLELSSTEIRNDVFEAFSVRGSIPDAAEWYMYKEGMYQPSSIRRYMDELKEILPTRRYLHSISVMRTAIDLANIYGADRYNARLAGLLHDCAKSMSHDELRTAAPNSDAPIQVLHAPAGAVFAREHFGVTDSEVLQAIARHTTGDPDMTLLDKVICLADFIEPQRGVERFASLRKLAYEGKSENDLNRALMLAFEQSFCYIKGQGYPVFEVSYRTYERLKKQTEDDDGKIR